MHCCPLRPLHFPHIHYMPDKMIVLDEYIDREDVPDSRF